METAVSLHSEFRNRALSATTSDMAASDAQFEFSAGRVRETGSFSKAGCPRRSL